MQTQNPMNIEYWQCTKQKDAQGLNEIECCFRESGRCITFTGKDFRLPPYDKVVCPGQETDYRLCHFKK